MMSCRILPKHILQNYFLLVMVYYYYLFFRGTCYIYPYLCCLCMESKFWLYMFFFFPGIRSSMVSSWKSTRQQWICCTELSPMWHMGMYFILRSCFLLTDVLFVNWLDKFTRGNQFNNVLLMLQLYRYPNLKSVKELIYKRGYGKLNKQRSALTDNSIIEQVFNSNILI